LRPFDGGREGGAGWSGFSFGQTKKEFFTTKARSKFIALRAVSVRTPARSAQIHLRVPRAFVVRILACGIPRATLYR
jgi:hypothetical protein